MKCVVPYEKEIKFGSKIAEICSISLEHEMNVLDESVEGNFIVSGEYKSHELSVNKETFNYKLPFSVEVTDNIVKDSIEFTIDDFTYDIVGDDVLKINIEFSVSASENDDREAFVSEINDMLLEPKEETEIIVEQEKNALEKEDSELPIEEVKETLENNERIDKVSEEMIIGSASDKEDEFATYHIHIVKSGDTVETICSMYQVDVNTLKEYNNMENINIGEKIIIPEIDE